MAEEFEFRDMSGAEFWGVNLTGSRFRDVNLTDVAISHAWLVNVNIDALVENVVINGVDVTQYINDRDRWYPLRSLIRPPDAAGMIDAWNALEAEWAKTIEQARALEDQQLHQSVGGEWSFVQTLRHLVFAMDKWVTSPVLGKAFSPLGLPNKGSANFGWPDLDPNADPTLAEVLEVRAERAARFRSLLESLTDADLLREVDVLENGTVPVSECLYTVFEEEFHHNRYALRDLARLV